MAAVASEFRERSAGTVGFASSRDDRLWLGGLAVVVACSWARFFATGSLKVDQSYPSEIPATLLLVVLAAGYGCMVFGWKGLLDRPGRPTTPPRTLAYAGLVLAAVMVPMLSNDIFSMFAYGTSAAHGDDVYASAKGLHGSVWFPFVGARWNDAPCVYGPASLVMLLPAGLGGGNPWLALLAVKLVWLVPLVAVMETSFRSAESRPAFHAMVWLNPLFVVEGLGQLHTDLLGLVAVTAGIFLQSKGKPKSAWAMLGVAVLAKYTFLLAAPWFWLSGARSARERALRLPAIAAMIGALAVAFFAPFWRGLATLTAPAHALAAGNPGGTLTEIVGHLVHLARGGKMAPPDMPVAQAMALDIATHGTTWAVTSFVLGVVSLAIAIRVLRAMLSDPADEDIISLGTGVLVVVVATLASRRFEPWYLMAALPFFGLRCPPEWRRWWVAITAAAVAPTFMNVLPRSASILPAWSAVTLGALMIVFVSSFRARFLTFGQPEAEAVDDAEPILTPAEAFEPVGE